MATMREGQRGWVENGRGSLRLGDGTVRIIFGAPEDAADFDLQRQFGRDLLDTARWQRPAAW